MTTNQQRAAAVMAQLEADSGLMQDRPWCEDYARALADAGLLADDLPEPQTFPSGEKEWYAINGFVNLDPDGTITVAYDERDEDDVIAGVTIEPGELVFTRISEARAIANDLLAAVDHAEGAGHADS